MRKLFLVIRILLLAGHGPVAAQPFIDLLNVSRDMYETGTVTTAEALVPIKQKDNYILVGGAAQWQDLDVPGAGLRTSSLRIGKTQTWRDDWQTTFLAIPKLSSTGSLKTKDFQMGGVIINKRIMSESFSLKYGLYYNSEYFGPYFMPLAGFDWRVSEKLNLYGMLPGALNMEYKLTRNVHTEIAYSSLMASYAKEDGSYVREGHPFWGHNKLSGAASLYLTKNVVFKGEFGYSFFRQYQNYNKFHETTPNQAYDLISDGWFIRLASAIRVRLDNYSK